MKRLPAIDGLRAVAVLAVVAYHAGLPLPAGFAGVDVFFVISGYLITRLLLADGDLLTFYARRVRRIFPAAAVVVLAVLAASPFLLDPTQQAHTALSAGSALVFVANVFFQFTSGGYFDASAESMPLLHLWSLSVEEQFYFVWPALIALVPRHWLRPTMIGLALASFALANWLDPQAAFYQMPARAWELAAGGIVATLPNYKFNVNQSRFYSWLGLELIVAGCLTGYPGAFGVLPAVAGAVLVIAAVHGGASVRVLELRPVVGIGLISYSLYLWHWPLLAFYRATTIGEGSLAVRLALCALAFVLAALSWKYVEQPFRRMTWPKGRTVGYGAAVSAVLAGSACAVGATLPQPRAMPIPINYCQPYDPAVFGNIVAPQCGLKGRQVVIAGDSYSWSWQPVAVSIAKARSLRVVPFSRAACPPMVGVLDIDDYPGETEKCTKRNADLLAYIEANGADTIILAGRWLEHFKTGDVEPGLTELVRRIAPHVGRILVIGPSPEMRDHAHKCKGTACDVPRAEFDALAVESWRVMRALDAMPNVEVIDVSGFLCAGASCHAFRDGVAVYTDANHVTAATAEAFSKALPLQ